MRFVFTLIDFYWSEESELHIFRDFSLIFFFCFSLFLVKINEIRVQIDCFW